MALDFDQSKQNAAKCEPSRHGKTQNVNVPASQNRLVSGRTKNLTTAAKLALLNYSVNRPALSSEIVCATFNTFMRAELLSSLDVTTSTNLLLSSKADIFPF